MSCKAAILEARARLDYYITVKPKEGTADWFAMRAAALSLSFLRQCDMLPDWQSAEGHYKRCLEACKALLSEDEQSRAGQQNVG